MKHIALIAFALLVVAILAPVVLILTLPTAKVRIQAIGSTGKIVTRTNMGGEVKTGSEWLFCITNGGRANASWAAGVHWRRPDVSHDDPSPVVGDVLGGVLHPREGIVTNMIVATSDTAVWRGYVSCYTRPTPFHARLLGLGVKTPVLDRLLPQP